MSTISPHHCVCGVVDFDAVVIERIGDPPYELPVMACVGCGIVYVVTHAGTSERHARHLAELSQLAKAAALASGQDMRHELAPAPADSRKGTLAAAKATTPSTPRSRRR